jgi:uncharacterized RDD family membrane protein YckC
VRSGFDALTRDRQAREYWFRRLIAFVIDAIIVYAVIGIIIAAVTIPALITSQILPGVIMPVFGFGAALFSAMSSVILVVYFSFAESIYGASIGKSIMGLHVTTMDRKNPGLGASFVRNVSKIYWVILLLDVVVGLALEVDYKRKFSDKFVGITVTGR